MLAILKLEPSSLGVLAPVCSSMGFLASSVTKRCCMMPLGDISKMTVYRQPVWMRHWGADSCKPTNLWCNSLGIQQLCLGKLRKEQRNGTVPLARQYVDSRGRKRCHGVKQRLKKSQVYTKAFGRRIAAILPRLPSGVAPLRNPQDCTN
ncbi:unnamed protein product [Cladocopium goreaui]|uniref:Uncharacterized protein n=1 Tax=Cladocopium goreaui TaxID=2562237 RepID=A0A9P1FX99_9DINO|nr:unnamed protein product [Cladocopium goreaui]